MGLFSFSVSPCCAFVLVCLLPSPFRALALNRLPLITPPRELIAPLSLLPARAPKIVWLGSVFNLSMCGGPLPRLCLGCLFPPSLAPLSNSPHRF